MLLGLIAQISCELWSSEEFVHHFTDTSFVGWAAFKIACVDLLILMESGIIGQRQQLTEAR